jgi:hypothetical protein
MRKTLFGGSDMTHRIALHLILGSLLAAAPLAEARITRIQITSVESPTFAGGTTVAANRIPARSRWT